MLYSSILAHTSVDIIMTEASVLLT